MTPQLRIGWTGSVLLHLLFMLIALLIRMSDAVRSIEFVEMDWGAVAAPERSERPSPIPARPATTTKTAPIVNREKAVTSTPASRRVVLPRRTLPDPTQDMLAVQSRMDKMDAAGPDVTPEKSERSALERPEPIGSRQQLMTGKETDQAGTPSPSTAAGSGVNKPGTTGSGSGVGYNVQWSGGGARQRLSGDLPQYPAGTNVEAQVRIQAHVLPDGTVRMVQPIQKANRALEDVAMKELRLWRFEPLPGSVPQIAQTCVVTFVFKLR
ncbi:MAG: hypothetical protein A3C56_01345 [Ignavibacteria bacterium RIFCSPHIGHO2_02_FULL_56_12]|nr:MAG: hypothetical protein A3C56_01345 [Ignavibacteria bacterium RIFCSPHIGHO2_02_FULL_56_12]